VKVKEGDLTIDRSIFEFVQDYLNRESRQDQSAEQPNRNGFSPLRSKASFLPEPKTEDSAEADQTDWRLITASLRTIIITATVGAVEINRKEISVRIILSIRFSRLSLSQPIT
jgi:hypothetical protein